MAGSQAVARRLGTERNVALRGRVERSREILIALGLHGWNGTHDASAALVVDGVLVSCIEEERLTRRKHAVDAKPVLAVRGVLDEAGLEPGDVDVIAYGWDLPTYTRTHVPGLTVDDGAALAAVFGEATGHAEVVWVRHHLAHATCGLVTSGYSDAAVLVVDGQGEDRSISLFTAERGRLRLIQDWVPSRSLGLLYEAATLHCGFSFLEAGKTMGLAGYGVPPADPLPFVWVGGDFETPLADDLEEDEVTRAWQRVLLDRFGEPARPKRRYDRMSSALRWASDDITAHHPNVAAAAQATVERCLRDLVVHAQAITGHRRVVLVGGVALNCVANGLLLDQCDELFVPPTAHDAGVALGAALWVAMESNEAVMPPVGAAFGPCFTSDEVRRVIEGSKLDARSIDDPASEAAGRILRGEVIGWFQGRMEIGPRALGRRSILGLPTNPDTKELVNTIKGRELWRPLAPSILDKDAERLFGRTLDSPYMLISLPLTDAGLKEVPAVAHVDGSARMQTVADNDNDPYARLIRAIGDETGSSVVLNTSFNAPGEPVVCTPADAIRTFSTMGLDAIVIENLVVSKA